MAIEFFIQIDPDKIWIHDPGTGYQHRVSNRVVYRRSDGLVLALGEPARESDSNPGAIEQWKADEICAEGLFRADGSALRYEIKAMEHFTKLLHRQSQAGRPLVHFFTKLVDGFDYYITIPGYESYPADRRNILEQRMQCRLRIRRLVLNGREVQIPLWKRNLEFWSRKVLVLVMPLVMMVVAYLNMPGIFSSSALVLLAYLLFVTYSLHVIGKLLWMVLAGRLVPGHYRLCMLQGVRSSLSSFDRYLVRLLWQSPHVA
jgi:hypothetical protein